MEIYDFHEVLSIKFRMSNTENFNEHHMHNDLNILDKRDKFIQAFLHYGVRNY